MTINEWLNYAKGELDNTESSSSRLDTILIMENVLKADRSWLIANPDHALTELNVKKLNLLLNKRMQNEPMAYILHNVEFYGRIFIVSKDVLVPRPESEDMIDLLKELLLNKDLAAKSLLLGDIGTGSGNLGITAALEHSNLTVELIDIDPKALKIAKSNVDKFTINIKCLKSDLLKNVTTNYDILLCNLPYVPDELAINEAAKHEPQIALFGGLDGLDIYRNIFKQLKMRKNKPLYILIEAFPFQHDQLAALAQASGYSLYNTRNFIQVFRLINSQDSR